MADTKKIRVRQALKYGGVSVNGKAVTQYDYALHSGDTVEVGTSKPKAPQEPQLDVKIIYEDEHLFAVDKPAGLLTIATNKIKGQDALYSVNLYASTGPERSKNVFIVHRLDRDASGVLVMARSYDLKIYLQEHWQEYRKTYYAIVEGEPSRGSGEVESYLKENRALRVVSGSKREGARYALTRYRVLESARGFSLLEVELVTGRKHQIRVHLSSLGHPIVGDRDYGSSTTFNRRLALHACRLEMEHPVLQKPVIFESPAPGSFRDAFKYFKRNGF